MRARPRSLFESDSAEVPFTVETARALAERVLGFVSAPSALVTVEGVSTGYTEFAGSEVTDASDTRYASVGIMTADGKRSSAVRTTRLDDPSLKAAVAKAQALLSSERVDEASEPEAPVPPGAMNPALWHESALGNLEPARRVDVVRGVIAKVGGANLRCAGVIGMSARSTAVLTSQGHFEYGRTSTSECTVTARTSDGRGSGWASWKGEDWASADPGALAERAADLARRTQQSRVVEPGRYTVVLSPVALAELVGVIAMSGALDERSAREGRSVFSRGAGKTAIGERVFDLRVTLSADPGDAEGGFLPFDVRDRDIRQYGAVTWVRDGVLERLAREQMPLTNSGALRMRGGDASLGDMIASVRRGIYVTRFSHVGMVSSRTLVMSGVTRDGTFLIERGAITGAVRNLRFEDSPMRVLKSVQALGPAERVPVGGPMPLVMPGAVVADFLFTGVSDGV